MKANEDIDKLFREGTQKNYPYDENLWAKVEAKLPPSNGNQIDKSNWKSTFKLLFAMALILFFETDSIVSFNQYSPRTNNDLSYQSTPSDLVFVNKDLNTLNETSAIKSNTKAKTKPTKSNINSKEQDANSSSKKEEHLSNAKKAATKTEFRQEVTTNSNESNKTATLPHDHDKEDDFKLTSIPSDDKKYNSVFNSAKVLYPNIKELSQLSPLGFRAEPNYPSPMPQHIQKDKLNQLQQKFKSRDYFIELEVGRSVFMNKQLTGLNASQNEYRKEAENSRFQQSMGINILTDVKRFTVGVGFHLSSFHEQLSYLYNEEINKINVTYDTSYSVVNGNFNSNGTPVILIRENINENRTEVTEKVDRELIVNNQFKRISLPVSIGYSKTFGRFNAGLRTAVVFNYLYASTGGYIDNNRDNFYRFDEKQQLSDWVVGNRNQLRFGYSLNEFVVIGTSLNHEQDISSFTQNYSSKFNTYGMGVWLLYRPK